MQVEHAMSCAERQRLLQKWGSQLWMNASILGTDIYLAPTYTRHRRILGTDIYLAPTYTWHRRILGTDIYLAPTYTWHRRILGTDVYLAPTYTWRRRILGADVYLAPTYTWHRPTYTWHRHVYLAPIDIGAMWSTGPSSRLAACANLTQFLDRHYCYG